MFDTYGGKVDQTAVIGHAPEHREWRPGDPSHYPEVDRTARVEAFVSVDGGMRVPTRVGPRCWLMKHTHVGHDAQLGQNVELAPGAAIGGHCEIGDFVRIGLNACIRPGVKVGANARIGAGAVVVKDVPAGEVWAGNPAKCIQHPASPDPFDAEHLTAS